VQHFGQHTVITATFTNVCITVAEIKPRRHWQNTKTQTHLKVLTLLHFGARAKLTTLGHEMLIGSPVTWKTEVASLLMFCFVDNDLFSNMPLFL